MYELGGTPQEVHIPRSDAESRVRSVACVKVQFVSRASMTHERRHRFDVLAVGKIQGCEGMAQGIWAHALEAGFSSELVPTPLSVLVGPDRGTRKAKGHVHGRLESQFEHYLRLHFYPLFRDVCWIGVDGNRSSGSVRLGVVDDLLPITACHARDLDNRCVPSEDDVARANREHLLGRIPVLRSFAVNAGYAGKL
jgi:hypothetical protein